MAALGTNKNLIIAIAPYGKPGSHLGWSRSVGVTGQAGFIGQQKTPYGTSNTRIGRYVLLAQRHAGDRTCFVVTFQHDLLYRPEL